MPHSDTEAVRLECTPCAHTKSESAETMDPSVRAKLSDMEQALLKAEKRRVFSSESWAKDVPSEPGVYAIWERAKDIPVYVGESSSLKSRMSDVGRTVNHTFRRKAAPILGVSADDEVALTEAMSRRYDVSFIEMQLSRAELEEYLVLRWRQTVLNKPAKRLLLGKRYHWVQPVSPTPDPEQPDRNSRSLTIDEFSWS